MRRKICSRHDTWKDRKNGVDATESSSTNISPVLLGGVHVHATLIFQYTLVSTTSMGDSSYVMYLFVILFPGAVSGVVQVACSDTSVLDTIGAKTASSVDCWLKRQSGTLGVDIFESSSRIFVGRSILSIEYWIGS